METKKSEPNQVGKNGSTIILFSSAKKIRELNIKKDNGECVSQIEKVAREIEGVYDARWGEKPDVLILKFDTGRTNLDTIELAIANEGYDTPNYKGKTGFYAGMPPDYKYSENFNYQFDNLLSD